MKPGRFLFSGYGHNLSSNSFEKKKRNFGFPCCSTREDLSIDVSITNVRLIYMKPGRFLFSGYGQNSISNYFEKKSFLGGFHACSTREDLVIDVSITNEGLISMKPGRFHFSGYGHNSISNSFEKKGFPCCSTREDLSIDVSITNVRLISMKPWFLFSEYGQNSISNFLWKKSFLWGFHACGTREDLFIDVSITNVGLISTKPMRFLF